MGIIKNIKKSLYNISNDGIIIILAYPNTFVSPTHWENFSKILPILGIGNKEYIKAGHSALLLINKNTGKINYFDFGRYITPYSYGRVRYEETDPELHIPILGNFKDKKLTNLDEILLWIEKHPEKTHGDGNLIASVNYEVNYKKALYYAIKLSEFKKLPYGAFTKKSTNCAKFVAEVLLNSVSQKKVSNKIRLSLYMLPSPIGNVIKGKSDNNIYSVKNQKINYYSNRSVFKEYKNFFAKKNRIKNLIGSEIPNKKKFNPKSSTWLSGIGYGAWFKIEKVNSRFIISSYNSNGIKRYRAYYTIDKKGFRPEIKHYFTYPTDYKIATVIQNNEKFTFKKYVNTQM